MESLPKESDYFKSSDLGLSATIQLYGYEVVLERDGSDKVTFVIKRDADLDSIIQSFWSKNLKVDPLSYFESLKALKSRIYQK